MSEIKNRIDFVTSLMCKTVIRMETLMQVIFPV